MGHTSKATTQRRLAVRTDTASVDLAVSAGAPVESLIPPIVDALAASGDVGVGGLTAVSYQLALSDGSVLNSSKTLNELGIRDGATLILIRSSGEFTAPPYDDAAEAVSAAVAEVQQPRTRRMTRLVGVLVAGCLAGVAAAILIHTALFADATHRPGCVGVAFAASLLTLLAAVIAYRVFDQQGVGLTMGLMGIGFAALAGLFAVPGSPGAPSALFATTAAATAAGTVRVFGRHAVVFTSMACFAVACACAAAIGAVIATPPTVVGAGLAAISLALLEASPPVSVILTRLSPAPADGPDRLHAKAVRAHTWLTSLTTAFSASAAVGAISATTEPSLPRITLATVTGGVLVLRARAHQGIERSAPSIICGTVTLSAVLVASGFAYPQHALHIAALSMLLSGIALYLGFMSGSAAAFPTEQRAVELLHYFALATVAPLAFWLCGFYGAARSLNLQ